MDELWSRVQENFSVSIDSQPQAPPFISGCLVEMFFLRIIANLFCEHPRLSLFCGYRRGLIASLSSVSFWTFSGVFPPPQGEEFISINLPPCLSAPQGPSETLTLHLRPRQYSTTPVGTSFSHLRSRDSLSCLTFPSPLPHPHNVWLQCPCLNILFNLVVHIPSFMTWLAPRTTGQPIDGHLWVRCSLLNSQVVMGRVVQNVAGSNE